jgi:hypothetical protein
MRTQPQERTDTDTQEGMFMALQKGERYRCLDADCGCEIELTKGAAPGKGGASNPRCCCGTEMQKVG